MTNVDITKPVTPRSKNILDYIWDSDRHLKSKAENRLINKLDAAILSTIMFGYWIKYVDQSNLANAYVSGMQEDLKLYGNQYTFMQSMYNAALCICTIPGSLIATKVPPRIWLAGCEVGWMAFTFAQAGAKTANQMYCFRFMVGAFEASFAPVAVILMGSWYTRAELAKRVCLWYTAGTLGAATSGFLQAAVYNSLDGRNGLPGWRWLYIVCGLITIPTCALVFFIMPDYPDNNNNWFFTEEEREIAKQRCARAGMANVSAGKIDLNLLKYIFGSWRFWVIIPVYLIFACSVQTANYFQTWMKGNGFSVDDRNNIGAAMFLISIPFSFGYGLLADYTGKRWFWMAFGETLAIVPIGIIAIYPIHAADGRKMIEWAFLFCETLLITPVFFAWINEICHENAQERAFICGATNALFYMVNAWLPILIFPQTTAPRYKKGFYVTWAFVIVSVPLICFTQWMFVRQTRKEAALNIASPDNLIGLDDASSVGVDEKEKTEVYAPEVIQV